MRAGLYLHFPFCLKKCLYCDFNSSASSAATHQDYLTAVVREMELRQEALPAPVTAPTLYLGGGTPSLMAPALVAQIIEAAARLYGLEGDAEVTLEANPGTLTAGKLAGYRAAGVNRLSIGIQSFEDRLLQRLGRVHTAKDAVAGFEAARRAGFDNISIDLMHSLPEQSLVEWREALRQGIALSAEHISAYALSVEEGTPFAGLHASGQLPLPAEEAAARMFEETAELLSEAGYRHYEISNFALPGRISRHNSAYWSRESYLGFGAGAHSLWNEMAPSRQGRGGATAEAGSPTAISGRRWSNLCDVVQYLSAIAGGSIPEEESTILSADDAVSEAFFLGLRTLDGLDLGELESRYGSGPLQRHLPEVENLVATGTLMREGSIIRLAPAAVILANTVFSRFI